MTVRAALRRTGLTTIKTSTKCLSPSNNVLPIPAGDHERHPPEVKFDSKMMYVDAYVNKADGTLIGPYGNYGPGYDYVGGTGWNSGKRKVDAVDLFADGGYDLFGRQHNLMLGGSYSKQNNRYESSWANVFPNEIGSFYTYDGNFRKLTGNRSHWLRTIPRT